MYLNPKLNPKPCTAKLNPKPCTAEAHIGARHLALEFGKRAAQHLLHLLAIRIGAAREEGHSRDIAHRFAATFSKVSALVHVIGLF